MWRQYLGCVLAAAWFLTTRESTSAHSLQLGCQLRVLFLDLQLGPRGLGVGKGIDNLARGARKLSSTLEVGEGIGHLALLQEELGHGGDGNIAFGID